MLQLTNLKLLFARAVEIDDEAERNGFVAASCGHDAAMRAELEALLTAYRQAGAFMEIPAAANLIPTVSLDSIGEMPGTVIGPYKLLEQIGEGGMGLVFMAEQATPLRRLVALKIIKPGLDTRAVIARFEAERQALALMEHPNIARVFDAGATESGRPYFVMELVRGTPITDYCRERNVPLTERLQLFIEVCDAVQHAHQKGIIHRDLKPSNILVAQSDTRSVPKVIDFGVAKATIQPLTERTLFTAFSQIIGTPLYMSPEQADPGNQDIDTRSDVYSLGVVLYELLTGTTPFEEQRLRSVSHDEMRRILREEEPPRPSTRSTTDAAALTTAVTLPARQLQVNIADLKGDLDWIVMKALEKDRRRRYESPSALVADLDCFLNHQPVDACPPTRRYRLEKFVRRNRSLLLSAGAIASALLVGSGISLWQATRARAAEERATQALATAEARLKTARQAVDEMYTQVAVKWLRRQSELTPLQREFLEKALRYYQGFASESPDEPQAAIDVVRAQYRVAQIYFSLGDSAAAESTLQEASRTAEEAFPALSDPTQLEFELAKSLHLLGQVRQQGRRYESAKPVLERALTLIEDAIEANPSDPIFRNLHGQICYTISIWSSEQGHGLDIDASLLRSRQIFAELLDELPEDSENLDCMATVEMTIGQRKRLSNPEEAKIALQRALDLRHKLVAIDPDDPKLHFKLAQCLVNASSTHVLEKDGYKLDQEAYSVARALYEQFPGRPDYLEILFVSQFNYYCRLQQLERHEEALPIARSGLESARRLVQYPNNPDYRKHLVSAFIALHDALTKNDLQQEAAALRTEATQLVREDLAYKHHLGYLLRGLACDAYRINHWRDAIQLMEESIAASATQEDSLSWVILALAHAHLGETGVARNWLNKALPLSKPKPWDELDHRIYNEVVEVFKLST